MVFVIVSISIDIKKYLAVKELSLDNLEEERDSVENVSDMIITSVNSLLLWFKLLYFLRIFEGTGYLINMLIEVVKDMRYFILVLLITIIAFANSYFTISRANDDENEFASTYIDALLYSYEMALGNWDLGSMGEVALPYAYILFVIATLFNTIIMLNLLIAIISDTYARVQEKRDCAQYQEKARLIFENSLLIPKYRRLRHCAPNSLLLFVEKVVSEM